MLEFKEDEYFVKFDSNVPRWFRHINVYTRTHDIIPKKDFSVSLIYYNKDKTEVI